MWEDRWSGWERTYFLYRPCNVSIPETLIECKRNVLLTFIDSFMPSSHNKSRKQCNNLVSRIFRWISHEASKKRQLCLYSNKSLFLLKLKKSLIKHDSFYFQSWSPFCDEAVRMLSSLLSFHYPVNRKAKYIPFSITSFFFLPTFDIQNNIKHNKSQFSIKIMEIRFMRSGRNGVHIFTKNTCCLLVSSVWVSANPFCRNISVVAFNKNTISRFHYTVVWKTHSRDINFQLAVKLITCHLAYPFPFIKSDL